METRRGSGQSKSQIDEGFRAWNESCPCCLSEAHPEVKAALDLEKAQRVSIAQRLRAPVGKKYPGSSN